jgi:hypothetical protein
MTLLAFASPDNRPRLEKELQKLERQLRRTADPERDDELRKVIQ